MAGHCPMWECESHLPVYECGRHNIGVVTLSSGYIMQLVTFSSYQIVYQIVLYTRHNITTFWSTHNMCNFLHSNDTYQSIRHHSSSSLFCNGVPVNPNLFSHFSDFSAMVTSAFRPCKSCSKHKAHSNNSPGDNQLVQVTWHTQITPQGIINSCSKHKAYSNNSPGDNQLMYQTQSIL